MRTIIVATDFSPAAHNAVNYATDMALALQAQLVVLHVYQIPVAVTDTPLLMLSVDELRDAAEEKLKTLYDGLMHITSGKLAITTVARLGNTIDELEELASNHQPFAIVLGTTGMSNFEATLFGSTTALAVKHLNWPVFAIPTGKEYGTGIQKIGFACDFNNVRETTPFAEINNLVKIFGASLHVVHIEKESEEDKTKLKESSILKLWLEESQPSFEFITHDDIEDAINEFAENSNLDLLIVIPKKHSGLAALFHKSNTKQLIFHSNIPVVCMHEE